MNSWIVETIQRLGQAGFSQILNALLIRIPVVVVGKEERETNLFISNLAKLAPHREQVIFWTDFVTPDEANQLFENEKQNQETRRVIILCNANVIPHALSKMFNYHGWVIAVVPKSPDEIEAVTEQLRVVSPSFLLVYLSDNPRIQIHGEDPSVIGTEFEDRIASKVLDETSKSIARLSRLLAKKVDRKALSSQLLSKDRKSVV
jgi:hypothetical protein